MLIWVLVVLALGMFAYIRLAPVDTARWHQPIVGDSDKTFAGGAMRVVAAGPDGLKRVDAAARALPRTVVIAGSVEQGRVTYMTRSKVVGFPDFTTVEQDGDTLRLYARLRFGRRDFGVNAARLRNLVAVLQ